MTPLEQRQQNLAGISPDMLDALGGDTREGDRLADLSAAVADLGSQLTSLPAALASLAVHFQGQAEDDSGGDSPLPAPSSPGQPARGVEAAERQSVALALSLNDLLATLSQLAPAQQAASPDTAPLSAPVPREGGAEGLESQAGASPPAPPQAPSGDGILDRLAVTLADAAATAEPPAPARPISPTEPVQPAADDPALPPPPPADREAPSRPPPAPPDDPLRESGGPPSAPAPASAGDGERRGGDLFGRLLESLDRLAALATPAPAEEAGTIPASALSRPAGGKDGMADQQDSYASLAGEAQQAAAVEPPAAPQSPIGADGQPQGAGEERPSFTPPLLLDAASILGAQHGDDQSPAPIAPFTRTPGEPVAATGEGDAGAGGAATAERPAEGRDGGGESAGPAPPLADFWGDLAAVVRATEAEGATEAVGVSGGQSDRPSAMLEGLLPMLARPSPAPSSLLSSSPELSRIPEAEPGMLPPWAAGAGTDLQGSRSGLLDVLETPHAGSIDVLNRIAEGVEALLEAFRERKSDGGGPREEGDRRESRVEGVKAFSLFAEQRLPAEGENGAAEFMRRMRI